jgi:hypothetical protein
MTKLILPIEVLFGDFGEEEEEDRDVGVSNSGCLYDAQIQAAQIVPTSRIKIKTEWTGMRFINNQLIGI